MINPEQCIREEMWVQAAMLGGVEEVLLSLAADNTCTVSIHVERQGLRLYLASKRKPDEPRVFARVDTAIRTTQRLIGAKRFLVQVTGTPRDPDLGEAETAEE